MKVIKLIAESFKFAWNSLKVNKFRTVLSLGGVTVGIFAIIAVFTVVDSLENSIKSSFDFLGTNTININKWPYGFGGEYKWWDYVNRPYPDMSDYEFLKDKLEYAEGITLYVLRGNQSYKRENNSIDGVFLSGVTYSYNTVFDFNITEGRYFTEMEGSYGRKVAVIGQNIAEALFPNTDPIGKELAIRGVKFKVIGLFEKEGEALISSASKDDICLIPYKAFSKIYYSGRRRGIGPTIAVKGKESDIGLVELEGELTELMRRKHALKPKDKNDFAINRTEAIANAIGSVFDVIGIAGWVIGGFSILVGGFGIANIMFVSVRERTNIIGIQKSLGAKNYFILFEFLFESIFLSLIGGLIGLLMVYALTFVPMGSLETSLSVQNITIGLVVSTVIGTVSGIVPAALAARLDPVIAIRTTA